MKITDIDKNFKIETSLPFDDVQFYDCEEAPFKIYGLIKENGSFRRLPEEVARSVSDQVYFLHTHTAGGRIRFQTDSEYIAINVDMGPYELSSQGSATGGAGFDIYMTEDGEQEYLRTFIPPLHLDGRFESYVTFVERSGMKELTINFPDYAPVRQVLIGLQKTAKLLPPNPYKYEKPVVFYGSSITQGACASRPGNAYTATVCRHLDTDYINLGFSGSAKGEDEIANYIKDLDMSVFVYDYDHNAPEPEDLLRTHKRMFDIIRKQQPDLPIIMMSKPNYRLGPKGVKRLEIIRATYEAALAQGDKNVYFIPGPELMAIAKNEGTVENCHPNDLGMFSMAKAVEKVLKNILP